MDGTLQTRRVDGDLLLRLAFERPQFALLVHERTAHFCGALYSALLPFGVRSEQMRLRPDGFTGDAFLEVPLDEFRFQLRCGIRAFEMQFLKTARADREWFLGVASAVEIAVRDCITENAWSSVSLEVRSHVRDASDALAAAPWRYLKSVPDELGSPVGAGVSFYFAAPASEPDLGTTMLVVEPSAAFTDALFFRIQMTWGQTGRVAAIGPSTESYLRRCAQQIQVPLPEGWL